MKFLVLDAMGVVYTVGDDVRDLLCPFIVEKGGTKDISRIEKLYLSASIGNMPASEFWEAVGLNPALEDDYLLRHKLTDGLINFLEAVNSRGYDVWCLSNDLSEWSKKLRIHFGLDKYICGFVISGDVGIRKPDRAIFDYLVEQINVSPHSIVFVDDQQKNLNSAAELGFSTILFVHNSHKLHDEKHQVAVTFNDLLLLLT